MKLKTYLERMNRMIWINIGDKSYQATGINIATHEEGRASLWIERPTGKTLQILNDNEDVVREHKEAIDFAVKEGHKIYEIQEG